MISPSEIKSFLPLANLRAGRAERKWLTLIPKCPTYFKSWLTGKSARAEIAQTERSNLQEFRSGIYARTLSRGGADRNCHF